MTKVKEQHKRVMVDMDDVSVEFEGVWRRIDLDTAYRLMIKRLGAYYAKLRAEARATSLVGEEDESEKE